MSRAIIEPTEQGTRVATPGQGTLDGPKQPPPRTQIGGTVSVGLRGVLSQIFGWPANPARNILAPSGARSAVITTDHELQTQAAPPRVLRQMFERNRGLVWDDLISSFPVDAGWSLIPHQYIPRRAQGTGPILKGTDDNAPIPAIYAGNPRQR